MKAIKPGRIFTLVLMTALLITAITACGTQEKPSDTVRNFYYLLTERQFSEAYNLLASEAKVRMMMSEEAFVQSTDQQTPQGLTVTSFKVVSESEEGDQATVKFSVTFEEPGKEPRTNEVETKLIKENGQWKILI